MAGSGLGGGGADRPVLEAGRVGDEGINWPAAVARLIRAWDLSPDGGLLVTRSSWLLPVRRGSAWLMLKVARMPDEAAGFSLMSWWDGRGAARVVASAEGSLLMERAMGPGSLQAMARTGRDQEACRILCETAARLHEACGEVPPSLHPLERWFEALFARASGDSVLMPASRSARGLLAEPRDVGPLHGDLHQGNVLDFGSRGWLAVDPHGLIGERAFDYANLFTNPDLGDLDHPLAVLPGRLEARLAVVTAAAGLDPKRLLQWIIAWTGLSAAWSMAEADDRSAAVALRVNAEAVRLART